MNLTYERVQAHLDRLKLRRVAELIDPVAEQATRDKLSYLDFFDRLLDAEAEARAERRMVAKTRLAHFPFVKTIADFDCSFQPTIDKPQVKNLATLRFLANGENDPARTTGRGLDASRRCPGHGGGAHGANVYFVTVPERLDQLARYARENRISDRLRSLRHHHPADPRRDGLRAPGPCCHQLPIPTGVGALHQGLDHHHLEQVARGIGARCSGINGCGSHHRPPATLLDHHQLPRRVLPASRTRGGPTSSARLQRPRRPPEWLTWGISHRGSVKKWGN